MRIESKELGVISLIPNEELNTDESRSVLPDVFPFHEAVKASAISNVLVAALCQKKWEVVGNDGNGSFSRTVSFRACTVITIYS